MSDTADGLVATFKGGKGYDAPWLVIHAPDPAQFQARLAYVSDELLHQLAQISATFQAIVAVEEKVGPTTLAAGGSAPSAAPSTAPAQSAPPQPVNNVVPIDGRRYSPNGTVCSKCNGPLFWQEWTTAKGNAAKAYKCGGKGFGHDIEWPDR